MESLWTIDVGTGLGSTGVVEQLAADRGSFEYDALNPKGRRKSPTARIVREDVHVRGAKRKRLIANARDLTRNFSVASWMIRRHLDYCASFTFQSRMKDRGLNREIETLLEIQSKPMNCDRGGRFTREKLFRYLEAARCTEGDVGLLRLRSGQSQIISSDLIRQPSKPKTKALWIDGVEVDFAGMPKQYQLYSRGDSGQSFTTTSNSLKSKRKFRNCSLSR